MFFDIDTIADHDQGLPHMLPKPEALAKAMSALGLGDGMRFVVYDALGLFAAARVWWTLRAYGVEDVRILEGGLPRWIKEGRPLETGDAHPRPRVLHSAARRQLRRLARRGARGAGERLGAGRGRAPGRALSRRGPRAAAGRQKRPHARQPQPAVRRHRRARPLKPPDALRAAFAEHKIDLAKPIITTCGSGVTAAILALAVEEAGGKVEGLYDGSWAEWGSRADCPVVTGPA